MCSFAWGEFFLYLFLACHSQELNWPTLAKKKAPRVKCWHLKRYFKKHPRRLVIIVNLYIFKGADKRMENRPIQLADKEYVYRQSVFNIFKLSPCQVITYFFRIFHLAHTRHLNNKKRDLERKGAKWGKSSLFCTSLDSAAFIQIYFVLIFYMDWWSARQCNLWSWIHTEQADRRECGKHRIYSLFVLQL